MKTNIGSLACSFLLAVVCTACSGESNRKVIQRYEPQFTAKRQQFQKIAVMLPPAGSVKEASPANLSPKPVYDAKNSASNNTEIVMFDQLLDPDAESVGHQRLDLLLSRDLLIALKWTGPKNPMSADGIDKHNPNLEQTLKQALAAIYLVVIRPVNFVAPVATDEATFKGGMADLEGFVVDLTGQKVAGSFHYSAKSASSVEYSTKKGASDAAKQARLEDFAYSSLYEDARKKLKPLLEQTTGGTFAIDR
jgi:hypothetical protein